MREVFEEGFLDLDSNLLRGAFSNGLINKFKGCVELGVDEEWVSEIQACDRVFNSKRGLVMHMISLRGKAQSWSLK